MTNNNLIDVSVVLPCRNEEESIGICINKIKKIFQDNNINGEIIVSDSSTDKSPQIAQELEAKIIKHNKKGYGVAYLEGFGGVGGKYIFMADCDNTYDFNEIPRFLKYLEEGYDFVIGDRFGGKMEKGAMPWSHRYIGNPVLSSLFRMIFNTKINDIHCGMRAFKKDGLDKLDLKTTGMEFASEMIIEVIKNDLKTKELPISYHARYGESKLKTISDGLRHLKLMIKKSL